MNKYSLFALAISISGTMLSAGNLKTDITKDSSSIRTFNLNDIVVTSSRSGVFLKDCTLPTSVIKSDEILSSGGGSLSDALENLGGLRITSNQFGGDLDLQGCSGRHILVMLDGVRIVGRQNGQADISQIPSMLIDRVEIIRGPLSSVYGSDAQGGVLNIITRSASEKFQATINLRAESRGKYATGFFASAPLGGFKTACTLNIRKAGSYDLDESTPAEDGAEYKKYDGAFNLSGNLGSTASLAFKAGRFSEEQNLKTGADLSSKTKNDRSNFQLNLTDNFSQKSSLSLLNDYVYYRHNYSIRTISTGIGLPVPDDEDRLLRGEAKFNTFCPAGHLLLGTGHEHETMNGERISGKEKSNDLQYFFFEDEIKPSNPLTFVLGARYDKHSEFGGQLSPKISLMLSPENNLRIRLNYGQGFRSPDFKELYMYYADARNGYIAVGNPLLKPERSYSFGFNAEYWQEGTFHLSLDLFYNRIRDLIDYDFNGMQSGLMLMKSTNLSAVKSAGAAINSKFIFSGYINQSLNFEYNWSQAEGSDRVQSFKPEERLFMVTTIYPNESSSVEIRQKLTGPQYYYGSDIMKSFGKERIDWQYIIDLCGSLNITSNAKLSAGVNNITDRVNKLAGIIPGREIFTAIELRLK